MEEHSGAFRRSPAKRLSSSSSKPHRGVGKSGRPAIQKARIADLDLPTKPCPVALGPKLFRGTHITHQGVWEQCPHFGTLSGSKALVRNDKAWVR